MYDHGDTKGKRVVPGGVLHALIPSGDTMLRRGDHIYVTAPVTVLSYLMKRLGITQKKIRTPCSSAPAQAARAAVSRSPSG